jgi:hypothetical protein
LRYRVIQSVHPRFSITRTYDGVRREASRDQDGKVAYPPAYRGGRGRAARPLELARGAEVPLKRQANSPPADRLARRGEPQPLRRARVRFVGRKPSRPREARRLRRLLVFPYATEARAALRGCARALEPRAGNRDRPGARPLRLRGARVHRGAGQYGPTKCGLGTCAGESWTTT